MAAFVLIVIIASIGAFVVFMRGETLRFETGARPQQILMQANSEVGTKKRWTVNGQSEHNVAFSYHKGPNKLIALILLLLFLIPGLVYLVLAGKRESLNIMFDVRPDGTTQVQTTSNGFRGKMAGRSLRAAISSGYGAVLDQHAAQAQHMPVQHPHGQPIPYAPHHGLASSSPAQLMGTGSTPFMAAAPTAAANYAGVPGATGAFPAVASSAWEPGWYPDSEQPGYMRYYDGSQWTEHRSHAR